MKKNVIMMALVGLLLGFSSCVREVEYTTFNAEIAQLEPDTENEGGKNYFQNEHFIYWEEGDAIAVGTDDRNKFTLTEGAGSRFGTFENADGKSPANNLVAVYPATSWREGTKLFYPNTSVYREANVGDMAPDFTFGKNCFPMVASLTRSQIQNQDSVTFHSVSGILRIGLFSNTVSGTISSIDIEAVDGNGTYTKQQISGEFEIQNIDKYNPYLEATSTAPDDYKISITGINKTIGAGTKDGNSNSNLWTFYVPLPAQTEIEQAATTENLTLYSLKITVHSDQGDFSKNFGAKIRRNALSKMQVIEIDGWHQSTGQGNVHMVGNGTQLRPFQIYYIDDLLKARDAINSNGTINGQQITANTYFKVVRSDIQLTNENWTSGIQNFKGHFLCSSGHPTRFGIENSSSKPLFESVSAQGHLDSVTVYGTSIYSGTDDFCPLVKVNEGTMSLCVNQVTVAEAKGNLAGVCLTNSGVMHSCQNKADLRSSGTNAHVGGVCLTNTGKMRACVNSHVRLSGAEVGGIVYSNQGSVNDAAVDMNDNNASGSWGLVAFSNVGTIQNCIVSGEFVAAGNKTVGGICNANSGYVLECRNVMSELKGAVRVGGLVATMTGGEIRNSYSNCEYLSSAAVATSLGGLVGRMNGGRIANSYARDYMVPGDGSGSSSVGGIVGFIEAAEFFNVYSSNGHRFYGQKGENAHPSFACCYHNYAPDEGILAYSAATVATLNGNISGDNRYHQWVPSAGAGSYATLRLSDYVGNTSK